MLILTVMQLGVEIMLLALKQPGQGVVAQT